MNFTSHLLKDLGEDLCAEDADQILLSNHPEPQSDRGILEGRLIESLGHSSTGLRRAARSNILELHL
jgi:hypothetical protein